MPARTTRRPGEAEQELQLALVYAVVGEDLFADDTRLLQVDAAIGQQARAWTTSSSLPRQTLRLLEQLPGG